jgi:hypothetical protein
MRALPYVLDLGACVGDADWHLEPEDLAHFEDDGGRAC